MSVIWQDCLYSARTMRNNPVFAATAVLIMALGIGGDTAIFAVIRSVLLKPLAYQDPDKLVRISGGATPARFEEMKSAARSFTGIAAFTGEENLALGGGQEPEVVKGVRVSAGFLRILRVDPLLGRSFTPADDSPGGARVAMISYELWQRRFGADPRIAGKEALLAATPYTIIGVLPPRFQFPFSGMDVWITAPSEWPAVAPASRPLSPFLTVFGRLKDGVSLEQASAEAAVIHRQYATAHPAMLDAKPKKPVRVTQIKDELVANVRTVLWMLFGAVGFVLLIACANVASLLLARAASRSREFAVRAALGATRARMIGQLLVESVLLSCAGGTFGVLLARFSLRWISSLSAIDLPRAHEIQPDWLVFGFAAGLSIVTGLMFGLVPSLGASRPDLIGVLRASGTAANSGAPGRFTVRALLVVTQIALSIVLLIGAALLIKSMTNLRGADPGFNPANLLTLRISLPQSRYETNLKKAAFYDELRRRLVALPGVRGAAAAMTLPMMGFAGTPVQDAAQPPLKLNERPIATILVVTPEYFRTLGIPLRLGRDFTARDLPEAQRVTIIDEAAARRFWPSYPAGENPVGKHLLIGGTNAQPAEIVGVVAGVHQNIEKSAWPESVYVCLAQNPPPSAMLAIRTEGDPLGFTRTVREQVLALDRNQPVSDVRTMQERVEEAVGQRRFIEIVLGSFAGVALLLSLVGMYGVISYSVEQRVRELGIRRALGARPVHILALVMGQGLGLTLVGIGIGTGAAFALTRLMQSLLFHVSAADPATFVAIALLFLCVAFVANYIPARRATRIDPMAALRV